MKINTNPYNFFAKLLIIGLLTLITLPTYANVPTKQRNLNLIPQPKSVKVLSNNSYRIKNIERKVNKHISEEGYTIKVLKDKVLIEASDERGFIWADVTLKQLRANGEKLPHVEIEDHPEFKIRGFMYDTGRNFIEIADIKHFIDLISFYKVNVFHWHLTDKPAWRIECRAYPQLNDPRYQRIGRDAGRFYSYDQIREVIKYAKERGVMIVPEIDMPGHSDYFNATFKFGMDSEEGMKILEKCLAEFFSEISITDCPYLHIGSDEVHIKDPQGFMSWAENIAHKAGRKTIAWDPGLHGSKETVYQIWREGIVDAFNLEPGKKFIDSYMGYLNIYDPFVLSNRIFYHTPCTTGKGDTLALGGILCLWNDVRIIDKSKLLPHNGMLSGLLPFAERFWNGGTIELENPINGAPLLTQFQQKMSFHRDNFLENEDMKWVATMQIPWAITLTNKDKSETDSAETKEYGTVINLETNTYVKNADKKESLLCQANTSLFAPADTTILALVGFDAPARSNRISDGIPLQGEWENKGELKVNGIKINPPVWNQPGLYQFHYNTWARHEEELPYTDEQFFWMRKPMEIKLMKGWNKIEISVLRSFIGQRFMFAFVPVRVDANGKLRESKTLDMR